MEPITYFDVAGQVVAKHPVQVLKLEMLAHASLAAGCFWQVHDFAPSAGVSVPANGAVPVKSWPANAAAPDYKTFVGGELCLQNGLYVCMSTTEATKTLGTGNNKFSSLAVELVEQDPLAAAVAAEAQGAQNAEFWTPAEGPKKLVRLKVTNLEGQARWLHLFAHSSIANGDRPLKSWALATNGEAGDTIDLRFGTGLAVRDNDGSAGGLRQGCFVALSSTEATFTATEDEGMDIYGESIT